MNKFYELRLRLLAFWWTLLAPPYEFMSLAEIWQQSQMEYELGAAIAGLADVIL